MLEILGNRNRHSSLGTFLPTDKLTRVRTTVREWLGKKVARKRDLKSLLDLLQHAAKVVRPGRRFVQVMSAAKADIISIGEGVVGHDGFVLL